MTAAGGVLEDTGLRLASLEFPLAATWQAVNQVETRTEDDEWRRVKAASVAYADIRATTCLQCSRTRSNWRRSSVWLAASLSSRLMQLALSALFFASLWPRPLSWETT